MYGLRRNVIHSGCSHARVASCLATVRIFDLDEAEVNVRYDLEWLGSNRQVRTRRMILRVVCC